MSENYDKMRRPPQTALRQIQAGDLKGKTDINPQWRYEIMDATFGACGIGWKYEIVRLWDVPCQDGTVLAFAQVNVYTKQGDGWSDPIPGIGGNTLNDMVKGYSQGDPKRPKPNDEGYKMAVTDALSVALKMLGVGADIYAGLWDGAKYRDNTGTEPAAKKPAPETGKPVNIAALKQDLIDYVNEEPAVLNAAWIDYANKAMANNSVEAMQKAIAEAVKNKGAQG